MARFLWSFDVNVIDGLVNLQATVTLRLAAAKQWFDEYIVDGLVNGIGLVTGAASSALRLVQTGRLANYLLVVLFGLIVIGLLSTTDLLNWVFMGVGIQ